TVVEGHERVPGEHELHQVAVEAGAEVERPGRALTWTAGDEEHHAARRARSGQDFDVKIDRPRKGAGAIERYRNRPALDAGLPWTGRERDGGARLAGASKERQRCRADEETATHEARQGTSAGVPCQRPVSARELEHHRCSRASPSSVPAASARPSPPAWASAASSSAPTVAWSWFAAPTTRLRMLPQALSLGRG